MSNSAVHLFSSRAVHACVGDKDCTIKERERSWAIRRVRSWGREGEDPVIGPKGGTGVYS